MPDKVTAARPLSEGLGRDLVGLIRELILSGTFAPGEKLLPTDVQARFGVSHIPVREAFRALEAEGLIVTTARHSPRVAAMSLAELHEVYELRRLLEPALVANAALMRTPDDVVQATEAFERFIALDDADLDTLMAAHHAFHWALIRPGVHALTRRTLEGLWAVSERYVRMSVTAFHTDRLSRHDHEVMLAAFVAGDAERARAETLHHLQLVEDTTINALLGRLDETPGATSSR